MSTFSAITREARRNLSPLLSSPSRVHRQTLTYLTNLCGASQIFTLPDERALQVSTAASEQSGEQYLVLTTIGDDVAFFPERQGVRMETRYSNFSGYGTEPRTVKTPIGEIISGRSTAPVDTDNMGSEISQFISKLSPCLSDCVGINLHLREGQTLKQNEQSGGFSANSVLTRMLFKIPSNIEEKSQIVDMLRKREYSTTFSRANPRGEVRDGDFLWVGPEDHWSANEVAYTENGSLLAAAFTAACDKATAESCAKVDADEIVDSDALV